MENQIKVETYSDKESTAIFVTKPDGKKIHLLVSASNDSVSLHSDKCNWELTDYSRTRLRLELMK